MKNTLKTTVMAVAMSLAMVTTANAVKPAQESLADVSGGYCFVSSTIAGGAFLAQWGYENGDTQTKWGGDLACTVSGTYGSESFTDQEVDIDMSIFEGWIPFPDGGTAWYMCNDDTGLGAGAAGDCTSAGYGLADEIKAILNDRYGVTDVMLTGGSCSLSVKAINPEEKGPQNYEKTAISCLNIQ